MYNFNETEMKNFADDIKAKAILEMETKQVPIITGGGLAVEKADKNTKFKTWLRAKYDGDLMVVKAITGTAGTTLPIDFASEMWNLINDYSLSKYCTNYKASSLQLQVQTLSTKPVVSVVGQGAEVLNGNTAVNVNKQITIDKYSGYQMFSKEMLDDNNYDLYGHLVKTFAEAVAKKMDAAIIATLDTDATVVNVGEVAADITLANVLSGYTGVQGGATKNAIWALHRTTYAKILALITAGTGVFTNANSLANPTLLGYPVILSEEVATYANANGSRWGYFGDFANVGFASRQEMEVELIKEGTLGLTSLANTRQVALVVDARFGAKVIDGNGVVKLTA